MSVCVVTGANGFVAQHVVQQLLAAGHTVRGTVRDADADKHAFLHALDGAAERLTLHSADLQSTGAFDDVIEGCDYAFHIASPYKMDYKDGQKELIEPAVEGALSLLKSVKKASKAPQRVVLTSSIAAILDAPRSGHTFNEDDWNETCKSGDYYRSKVEAEKAAWAFAKENGIDLVSLNPFMVIGPTFNDSHNTSTDIFVSLCSGEFPVIPPLKWGFVDVREVADAHLKAAFQANASGRYLLSSEVLSAKELIALLGKEFPQYASKLPSFSLDCKLGAFLARASAVTEKNKGTRAFLRAQSTTDDLLLDNSKSVQDLGVQYRSARDSIVDSVKNSVKWGHL